MWFLSKREKVLIGIISLLVIAVCGTFYIDKIDYGETIVTSSNSKDIKEEVELANEQDKKVKPPDMAVYIIGAIKSPGVYKIPDGIRLADLIVLAGGVLPNADLNKLNLAKKLTDEDKVYIPKIGEKIEETQTYSVNNSDISMTLNSKSASSKVNINTATTSQLDTLPGIGSVYAQNIIDYRNANGGFKSIEDIKNVSGIGDKRFDSIKDLITID